MTSKFPGPKVPDPRISERSAICVAWVVGAIYAITATAMGLPWWGDIAGGVLTIVVLIGVLRLLGRPIG